MTRGRKAHRPDEPERRCVATGESQPAAGLIRFVLAPDGASAVPDLAGKLPGRGAWLSADRAAAERAERKRLFSRAFKRQVAVPEGLADLLETLLVRRLVDTLSLARKAGQAVTGFEKVRERLRGGEPGALITARDAAADGREKLRRLAPEAPWIGVLDGRELGLAFGREFAIHAALDRGGVAARALGEAGRLSGFREGVSPRFSAASAAASRPDDRGAADAPVAGCGDREGSGQGAGTDARADGTGASVGADTGLRRATDGCGAAAAPKDDG
ncbi:MAG: RNA-binding protein [Pseudomonadota bacterium]